MPLAIWSLASGMPANEEAARRMDSITIKNLRAMKTKAIKKKAKTNSFKHQRLTDEQLKHVKGGTGGSQGHVPVEPEAFIGSTDTLDG